MVALPHYYNEFDPFAAEWLENLIAARVIPAGRVDRRSIKDVQPDDLQGYEQCHFFAGIGGWAEALRLAGWSGPCWTGSCPCQPFSSAGKRKGKKDERHLWPEFERLIAQCRPATIFGEQVASKDGRNWLAGIRTDLEKLGYAVGAADLCAASVGAPHIRQRLWWMADARFERLASRSGKSRTTNGQRFDVHEPSSNGKFGRMEHAAGDGWNEGRTESDGRYADAARTPIGLADSNSNRSAEHVDGSRERAASTEAHATDNSGPTHGLGNTSGKGQPVGEVEQDGQRIARVEGAAALVASSPRNGITTVECRDNRLRRISSQSGDEPLAYGIPASMGRGRSKVERMAIRAARTNRVGRLKGYGNAIHPEVGAQFVKACMEVLSQ